MQRMRRNKGFSLTEVLLAVATLSVGMVFVAGTFAVGVFFTTVSAERTTAAVAADEAFAKVRIFGLNPNDADLKSGEMARYENVTLGIDPNEFGYPSTETAGEKQYWWSELCRPVGDPNQSGDRRLVQVTVFVARKIGAGSKFPAPTGTGAWPIPMDVPVTGAVGGNILIVDSADSAYRDLSERWLNRGVTIVDNATGRMYRILDRGGVDGMEVELAEPWQGPGDPERIWVVPPPTSGGRDPCVAVYQELIRF